jgi:hypothetical protein
MVPDISDVKKILDEINAAVSSYDPVLKERARDLLLKQAFGVGVAQQPPSPQVTAAADTGLVRVDAGVPSPFSTLIEKWTPNTQADWALLGAYYFQRIVGEQNVTGFQVNRELKQHGYGVTNITDSFTANMQAEPARMHQTRKSGKSKQAKKLYLVTTAGIKYVEDRLSGVEGQNT